MRASPSLRSARNARGTMPAVIRWALVLAISMHLFLVSSAFLFERNQCLHFRSTASTPEDYRNFPRAVLGYSGIEDTDGDGQAGLGTSFPGTPESLTGLPTSNDSMTPEQVVTTCMTYLQGKGEPTPVQEVAGLEVCFNFSSDSCRMANGGSLESFLQRANNPVFQTMVGCARWEVVNVGPEITGTPTRGSLQTVLVSVVPKVEETQRNDRQFLWTIVRERRPPRQGHCLVHECVAVENAFAHTL